jgi:DNA invertase Pin-like site-specific DNA recombinase
MLKPLLLSMWSWMASFERERMSQRIKAGIQRRKNLGNYTGGRPGKTEPISENCEFINNIWRCKICGSKFSSENIYKKKWTAHIRRHKFIKDIVENTPPDYLEQKSEGAK